MFVDARTLPPNTEITAEVCVVGAGAAGITLARELRGSGLRVAVIESGDLEIDYDTQQLYDGDNIGLPYLDLTVCRLRLFGGTTNHWGGWCLPLDAIDFEPRPWLEDSGWPFPRAELEPFYMRAQKTCRLGRYDYSPAAWDVPAKRIPAPFNGPHFITKILQAPEDPPFAGMYGAELRRADDVTVYLNANLVGLTTDDGVASITRARLATLTGTRLTVAARIFILATGGVENARLLLQPNEKAAAGLGNFHDNVGRYFMVHTGGTSALVALTNPYVWLGFSPAKLNAYPSLPFIGVAQETLRDRELLNIRFFCKKIELAPVAAGVTSLKKLTESETRKTTLDFLGHLENVVTDLDQVAAAMVRRALFDEGLPKRAISLYFDAEQAPNRDSRLTLTPQRDALGLNRIAVDWRLRDIDKRSLNQIHALLAAEIGRGRFGRMKLLFPEDETTWPADVRGNEHHMGTTRMHDDPKRGVVDRDCRVHGLANLYVAGSSVFPTGGSANPTFTIVALATRLADHVRKQFA
jgi:choline dehydrogenase-like flavoprotein